VGKLLELLACIQSGETGKMDNTSAPLELAVVIPTFNERDNVAPVLEGLVKVLAGIQFEVIFVDDDSPDGTADCIRIIGRTNPWVRVIHRVNRRGLASACIEGMLSTSAPYIAVMDADLQHDERILPEMFARLKAERLDLVVATRKAVGGSMGTFSRHRVMLSNLGHSLSQWISKTKVTDPMSGFFVLTRAYLDEVVRSASGVGFKILLDLVASSERPVRVGEVAYTFRERLHGVSKLDIVVGLEYLQLLLDKKIGSLVPVRFVIFSAIGALGVVAAFAVLYVSVSVFKVSFLIAQALAALVAMTENFFLNNSMTYRDRRLKGWRLLTGLATFYLASSLGAVINIRIAEFVRGVGTPWYIAGVCGLAVGAVWNFGITSFITWRQGKRRGTRRAKQQVASIAY
jgi:dolichol-phosphate mannosyltransferase